MSRLSLISRSIYLAPGLASLICLVCVSCTAVEEGNGGGSANEVESSGELESTGEVTKPDLTGNWRKITSDKCAEQYPAELSFRDGDIYLVSMEIIQQDPAPIWQSGDYEVVDGENIKMQAANDAMLSYELTETAGGTLVFTDENGCTVEYERMPD